MRLLALFLFATLALAAVPVEAHGAAHGSTVYRLTATPTAVRDADSTEIELEFEEGAFRGGDLFLVSGQNQGPGTVTVTLVRNDTAEPRLFDTWSFDPDGQTHVVGTVLPESGEYNLRIETTHSDWTPFALFYDHPCQCPSKRLPPEMGNGAAVFAYIPEATGTFRAVVPEAAAHRLKAQIFNDTADTFEDMPVLATSTSGRFDGSYGIDTHKVTWKAGEGQRYYLVLTSTEALPPNARAPPHNIYDPWRVAPFFTGPVDANPAPLNPAVSLVAVAVAAMLLRRR